MSQSFERRLTSRERVVLRLHRFACAWCDWYLRQLGELHEACRERDDHGSTADMPDAARERIRRALDRSR